MAECQIGHADVKPVLIGQPEVAAIDARNALCRLDSDFCCSEPTRHNLLHNKAAVCIHRYGHAQRSDMVGRCDAVATDRQRATFHRNVCELQPVLAKARVELFVCNLLRCSRIAHRCAIEQCQRQRLCFIERAFGVVHA